MAAASAQPSATEPGQVEEITPLCDLVSQQAGLSSIFLLKVVKSEMVEYSYQWGGKTIQNKKVVCLLQSTRADQYCLGVAKLTKKDEPELNKLQRKFATGTTWKFKTVKLLDDKQAWIHTSCRITIDIRKSHVVSVLQSPHFPLAPEPTCNIADVLQLKHVQRFDLMAVPKEILDERSTSTGKVVFDVRLVDGSKNANDEYSSLPLTVFLKQGSEATEFKLSVGTEPRLFMCLQGSAEKDGKVKIATVKDTTWLQRGAGEKYDAMVASVATICGSSACADVQELPLFVAAAADYQDGPGTLTACGILDKLNAKALLGDAAQHLYQLNHVYVPPPHAHDDIRGQFGFFWQAKVWDFSKSITLGFKRKAMFQLAGLDPKVATDEEYEAKVQTQELTHPILSSLRVLVARKKPKQADATELDASQNVSQTDGLPPVEISAVVVEGEEQSYEDCPNQSVKALMQFFPEASDRLAAVPLHQLKQSPFYNMTADGSPIDKVVALVETSQQTMGKQLPNGYRLETDLIQDATHPDHPEKYRMVALCTIESAPCFTIPASRRGKQNMALAIVSKVAPPSKPGHSADLYIDAMQLVPSDPAEAIAMMKSMQSCFSKKDAPPPAAGEAQSPFEQRKCRRLNRYPTMPE